MKWPIAPIYVTQQDFKDMRFHKDVPLYINMNYFSLINAFVLFIVKILCSHALNLFTDSTRTYRLDTDCSTYEDELTVTTSNNIENVNSELSIDDIYIAVKTTHKNYKNRVKLLLDTWVPHASNSVGI